MDAYLFKSNLNSAKAKGISLFEYEQRIPADPKVKLLADLRKCYQRLSPDLAWGRADYSSYVSQVNSCLEPLLDRASTLPADSAQMVLTGLKSIRKDLELLTSQVKQHEKKWDGSKTEAVRSAIMAGLP